MPIPAPSKSAFNSLTLSTPRTKKHRPPRIKPGNIFHHRSRTVKILDFGLAK